MRFIFRIDDQHRARPPVNRRTRASGSGIFERACVRASGSRSGEKARGGDRRPGCFDRAIPSGVRRDRPRDVHGGRGAVAGERHQAVRQFMVISVIEAFGEIFATLRKSGVEPKAFLEIVDGSDDAAGDRIVRAHHRGRTLRAGRLRAAAGIERRPSRAGRGRECNSPMPMASLVHDHLLSALAQGQGEMDWSSVTRIAARNAGLR